MEFPSKEVVQQRYSSSAESSNSDAASSSSLSSSAGSSGSAESSSSEEKSSTSSIVASSSSGKLSSRCGDSDYDPEEEGCCKNKVYALEKEHYGKLKKQFCDSRDGNVYVYVKIGEQTWMAENLNYVTENSKCYAEGVDGVSVDSVAKNCATYGRLYDWATAMDLPPSENSNTLPRPAMLQGICPSGWHIPSEDDWNTLVTTVGGEETAGIKLRSVSGWEYNDLWEYIDEMGVHYTAGTDYYGFSALPSGGYASSYSNMFNLLWGSTEIQPTGQIKIDQACAFWYGLFDSGNVYLGGKDNLFGVRCIKN